MNESILAIVGLVVPIVTGFAAWVMHGLDSRIKSLEDSNENLIKVKLDKEDYYRDQGAMRETLRVMSNDIKEVANAIREWPKELITILTQAGKL